MEVYTIPSQHRLFFRWKGSLSFIFVWLFTEILRVPVSEFDETFDDYRVYRISLVETRAGATKGRPQKVFRNVAAHFFETMSETVWTFKHLTAFDFVPEKENGRCLTCFHIVESDYDIFGAFSHAITPLKFTMSYFSRFLTHYHISEKLLSYIT